MTIKRLIELLEKCPVSDDSEVFVESGYVHREEIESGGKINGVIVRDESISLEVV